MAQPAGIARKAARQREGSAVTQRHEELRNQNGVASRVIARILVPGLDDDARDKSSTSIKQDHRREDDLDHDASMVKGAPAPVRRDETRCR
jgi:hypothetical protein